MKAISKSVLAALLLTAGCDYFAKRDLSREREDTVYKSAMEDYRAGRIESAVEGFQRAVQANPANTSARFQLACLLQDNKRDFEGAYCAYREFLQQFPDSDKAKLARQRLATCEKELARVLSSRYGFDSAIVTKQACERLGAELKQAKAESERVEQNYEQAMRRIAELRRENTRLLGVLRGDAEKAERPTAAVADAKSLIEAEEGETDRIKTSADIERLRRESDAELADAAIAPLAQPADAKQQRAAREEAAAQAKEAERKARKSLEPAHEKRPAAYVVEEGDTLIRIAIRFYGRPSAWKKIREANKAVVSTDGRVKVGDRLVFPDPEK